MNRLAQLLGRSPADLRRIAGRAGNYYHPFDVRKVGAAKWRHIDNPTGELRFLQKRIYRRILSKYPFPSPICGGVPARSIKDNAQVHRGQVRVVALDIKSCFPNTSHRSVCEAWHDRFGCRGEVLDVLTKLTTFRRHLPQGAATSTALSNLVLLPAHDEIVGLAKKYGLRFSMYVDDVTLSGGGASRAINPVIAVLEKCGYSVSNRKTKIMVPQEGIEVTGLGVGEGLFVPKTRIDDALALLHEIAERGFVHADESKRLEGIISFVKWVNPEQGEQLALEAANSLPDEVHIRAVPKKVERRDCQGGSGCWASKRQAENEECSDLLTSRQAGELLGVTSLKTLKAWMEGGHFPGAYQTSGGRWRFPKEEVLAVKRKMEVLRARNQRSDFALPDEDGGGEVPLL